MRIVCCINSAAKGAAALEHVFAINDDAIKPDVLEATKAACTELGCELLIREVDWPSFTAFAEAMQYDVSEQRAYYDQEPEE